MNVNDINLNNLNVPVAHLANQQQDEGIDADNIIPPAITYIIYMYVKIMRVFINVHIHTLF